MNKNIKLIAAYKVHSKNILNFLIKNHEFKFCKINFYRLLQSYWLPKSKIGYMLQINKKIIGFFGIIESRTNIYTNSNIQICNMHTWVVNKKYRSISFRLIDKISKIPKIIISHSSLVVLNKIFFKYGFKILDQGYYILPSICLFNIKKKLINYKVNLINSNKIQQKHFINHQNFGYELININNDKCIIILEKKKKYFLSYVIIHSLNNHIYFNKNIEKIKNIITKEFKCFFIKIDSRFINEKNKKKFIYKSFNKMNKLYKLPENLQIKNFKKEKINNLYSEIQFI